ncbi:MAG: sigma 54-interacting transcriptional regulator [Phycisphaerae bacterium]
MQPDRPNTLGELRAAGHRFRTVKQELRENLIARLRSGEPVLRGLVGYETTVVPQVVNGLLAQHDLLLLGLRGQAKTRILRALPELLDEFIPVVGGLDVWDDPLRPTLRATQRLIDEHGDFTPIRWIGRDERYHEKLATPDVTIADLIGEIDLVKHAEGRYLSDESTMHFGLVPRSNRGIFAINELPDLPPRIQVGLFNVLEERDVQIRGFPVRLNLDLLMVFSANPEDYTNRGRIVTPLKDRIGTVIRTHYPYSLNDAMRISRENARLARPEGQPQVCVPRFVHETIEELVRLARNSPHINQQSGVSVRTSIAALEVVVANAERRALRCGEAEVVPRASDLEHVPAACRGKIELLLAESEDAEDRLLAALAGEALKNISENYLDTPDTESVVAQFTGGKVNIEVGDDLPAAEVVAHAEKVRGLIAVAQGVLKGCEERVDSPLLLASAVEFVLEALHVRNKLSKYALRERTFYKA